MLKIRNARGKAARDIVSIRFARSTNFFLMDSASFGGGGGNGGGAAFTAVPSLTCRQWPIPYPLKLNLLSRTKSSS